MISSNNFRFHSSNLFTHKEPRFIMKKILTIAATALLSAIAGAAHAAPTPVNITGEVTASCTIESTTPGTLAQNTAKTAMSATAAPATVLVKCNNGTKSLTLTSVSNTFPSPQSTPTFGFGFIPGGTSSGAFAAVPAAGTATTVALTDPTGDAGDTANINATVTAATGKLLKSGTYTVVVGAEITP